MTLTEVVVSAVILGISSQVSLQGWSRTSQAARHPHPRTDQQVRLLEQRLLASRRHPWPRPQTLRCRHAVGIRAVAGFWRGLPEDAELSKRHGGLNLQRMQPLARRRG